MISTIFFDLDGTLIDSAADITAALNAMLRSSGLEEIGEVDVRGMIGDGTHLLVARALEAGGEADVGGRLEAAFETFQEQYTLCLLERTRLYPGVRELLAHCASRRIVCCLCTNKAANDAKRILGHFDLLGAFETILGGDSTSYHKPDPRLIEMYVNREPLALSTLVFGDSVADFRLAMNAGTDFVLAKYGYPNFEFAGEEVTKVAETPLDLISFLN